MAVPALSLLGRATRQPICVILQYEFMRVEAQNPDYTSFAKAYFWLYIGLVPSILYAVIIFGLTMGATAIIRSMWPTSLAQPRALLHWLERFILPCVVSALLLLWNLAAAGRGNNRGPVFNNTGRPGVWIKNNASVTMRNVTVYDEVVQGSIQEGFQGGKVLERHTFQRKEMAPDEEWEISMPGRNKHLLPDLNNKDNNIIIGDHTRILAERRHWGPVHFIYHWERMPNE